MKKLLAALLLLVAAPAFAVLVNTDGATIVDNVPVVVPYTIAIESAVDDTCHYGAAVDDVPDTLDWPRHALLFGPTKAPVNLFVDWVPETNVTYGYVQFKEYTPASTFGGTDSYTWGSVAKLWIGADPEEAGVSHEFKVGLWDSVRVWAQGSADGLMSISVYSNVLE